MATLLSAKEARNTTIFAICYNGIPEVQEMSLHEFICESAEETTTPRGVGYKMFTREVIGGIFQRVGFSETISEAEYDNLTEEEQDDYKFIGEAPVAYQLCEWKPNGRVHVIDTYETEEAVNDEWYTRTYNYDFTPDDQRDTRYWFTREEAEAELKEMLENK